MSCHAISTAMLTAQHTMFIWHGTHASSLTPYSMACVSLAVYAASLLPHLLINMAYMFICIWLCEEA